MSSNAHYNDLKSMGSNFQMFSSVRVPSGGTQVNSDTHPPATYHTKCITVSNPSSSSIIYDTVQLQIGGMLLMVHAILLAAQAIHRITSVKRTHKVRDPEFLRDYLIGYIIIITAKKIFRIRRPLPYIIELCS